MIGKSGPPRADGVQSSFSVLLSIANTNLEALQSLQSVYGGRIDHKSKQRNNWRAGYALGWKGPAAVDLIQELRPHLLIKGEAADVALEFARLQRANYRKVKSDQDIAEAEALRATIKALNHRGVLSPETGT